jgi:HK97 family phage prohead protease
LIDLAHKTFEIKTLSDEGSFSAVISTDGVDRDGEIVAREAFHGSLGKTIPLIQSHDWGSLPVGKGVIGQTAEGTTLTGSFFLDTSGGAEAYKTAKNMADLQEFSVGFRPKASDFVLVDGKNVRKITDLELFEASLVLVGAARGTRLMGIKSAEEEPLTVAKALDFVLAEAKTDLDALHEAAKRLSEAHFLCECDMGDDCPMASKAASPAPPANDRESKMRELEAALASVKL